MLQTSPETEGIASHPFRYSPHPSQAVKDREDGRPQVPTPPPATRSREDGAVGKTGGLWLPGSNVQAFL